MRVLKMDDYYKGFHVAEEKFDHNFDEPAAIDMELLAEHLGRLKKGLAIEKPCYDFTAHSRLAMKNSSRQKSSCLTGCSACTSL